MSQEVLQLLEERDKLNGNFEWNDSVKIVNSIIPLIREKKKLNEELNIIETKVIQMEDDLKNNSVFSQTMRDINQNKSQIVQMEQDNNNIIGKRVKISEKQKDISNEVEKNRQNYDNLLAQKNTNIDCLAQLQAELEYKLTMMKKTQNDLNLTIEENIKQEKELESLQMRYEAIITRVIDIQNAKFVPKKDVVDLSSFKVHIPVIKGSKEVAVDNADEEDDANPHKFLDGLSGGESKRTHNTPITSIAFCRTGSFAAVAAEEPSVVVIDTMSGKTIQHLSNATGSVMALDFSPTDNLLLTASYDSVVRFYKLPTFRFVYDNSDNRDCVNDACFLSDEKYVTACRDTTVKLYDINKSSPQCVFNAPSSPKTICVMHGESLVLTGHLDGKIRGWDFRSEGNTFSLDVHKRGVCHMLPVPHSTKVISISSDGSLSIFDPKARKLVSKINIQLAGIPSEFIKMAKIDKTIIFGGKNGNLFEYDIVDEKKTNEIVGNGIPIHVVAAKPNIGLMITGDKSGSVRFWNKHR